MTASNVSRMLTIDELRILFAGGAVDLPGYGSITLQDNHSVDMAEFLALTSLSMAIAGRSRSKNPLISFFRSPNQLWNSWCLEHAWSATGELRDAAEQLGSHISGRHGDSSVADMKDMSVAILYGLGGLSRYSKGNGS